MAAASLQKSELTHFAPPHSREPWQRPFCDQALIHSKLSIIRGTEEGSGLSKANTSSLYEAAKTTADFQAATLLVDKIWRSEVEKRLVTLVIATGIAPIIAFPHPGFDDDDAIDQDAGTRIKSRNALPFAHAARLKIALDGRVNTSIKQTARVGRTKLSRFPRFVYQPSFTGEVSRDRPYILVDDTLTLGGTLAMMRSHIVREGGTVVAVTALAHSLGKNIEFAMRDATSNSLLDMYGPEMASLWKGEIGHDPVCLTDAEGGFLLDWGKAKRAGGLSAPLVHELRTRLDRARATCG